MQLYCIVPNTAVLYQIELYCIASNAVVLYFSLQRKTVPSLVATVLSLAWKSQNLH